MNDLFIFIFLFILVLAFTLTGSIIQHEAAHQTIFREAGITSHVEYSLTGGTTFNDSNTIEPDYVRLAQMETEAFGYQIIIPTIGIIFTLFICTMFISWKLEGAKQ